jgi:two-component system, response regulator, stage 0 sporulation protein A
MKIEKYLLDKGIKPHLKGFDFLVSAIMLVKEDKKYLRSVTTLLYPTIATMYNETPSKVERAIRHCLESSRIFKKNSEFIALSVIEIN